MVRSEVVAWTLLAATSLSAAPVAGQTAPATPARTQAPASPAQRGQAPPAPSAAAAPAANGPLEAVIAQAPSTAPGTYVLAAGKLAPAPKEAQFAVALQGDVMRGADAMNRVGIAVGAQAPQAVDVRLRVLTVAAAGQTPRVVADAAGTGTAGPLRLVREFSLAPGEYDLEAVVGHAGAGGVVASLAKSRLSVPDLRGSALTATPVVLGDAGRAAKRAELPFIFAQTTITPAVTTAFPQDGSVSVAFRIYNWVAKTGEKPDLTVEYLFYEQGTKKVNFFNKMKPQQLNGETLGPAFDATAGSVTAGMTIPLGAFTFGDFQLTVKVTDNRSKQTVERQVKFAVGS